MTISRSDILVWYDVPFWIGLDLVQLLLAELAEIVIWCLVLVKDSDTSAMLPNTTLITGNE